MVTGGASGLGRATACRLADEGARVAVVDLDTVAGEESAAHIRATGGMAGTFLMCRSVLPAMLAAGRGSSVSVASNSGPLGQPYAAAYCASKGGIINLTRALAVEYRRRGVRVNAIAPGGMQTPMLSSWELPEGAQIEEFAQGTSPIGYAEPSEIAARINDHDCPPPRAHWLKRSPSTPHHGR